MPENAVRLRRTSHPFGLLALVAFVTLVSVTGTLAQAPAAKKVLTIGDSARWKSIENSRRIIFETDGRVVTRYRAGRRPAVEYVEGRS